MPQFAWKTGARVSEENVKNEVKKGGEKVCLWSICWEEFMAAVVEVEVVGGGHSYLQVCEFYPFSPPPPFLFLL